MTNTEYSTWFRRGLRLLGWGLVCIPASYIPFFGALFFFPFSDLVLLGLSALVVGVVPLSGQIPLTGIQARVIPFLMIWVGLSLVRDFPLIPSLIVGDGSRSHPEVIVNFRINHQSPGKIAVVGDANPIIAAKGRPSDFEPTINLAGMRETTVHSVANDPTSADILDLLWRRGFSPEVGAQTFPRLSIRKTERTDDFLLEIDVLNAAGKTAGSFKRTLDYAPRYPGIRPELGINLVRGIFYSNLWRELLGRNEKVVLEQEVGTFLDAVLTVPNVSETRLGPMKKLAVSSVLDLPMEPTHGQTPADPAWLRAFALRRSSSLPAREACGIDLEIYRFGHAGNDSEYLGMPKHSAPGYQLLRHTSSVERTREIYCDEANKKILIFSSFEAEPANLKVAVFSLTGKLEQIHYLQLPFALANSGFVAPNSWHVAPNGTVRLTYLELAQIKGPKGDPVADTRNYRAIHFHSP